MKITEELFEEAIMLEDSLSALTNNYYDTHDLDYIEEHKDEYEKRLIELKNLFSLKNDDFFCNFIFKHFKIKKITKIEKW